MAETPKVPATPNNTPKVPETPKPTTPANAQPLAPTTPGKETTQTGGPTEPARTTTPATSSTTGAPTAPAPVKPGDVTTAKTAAPQAVPPKEQSATPNQESSIKAAEAAQRDQNINSGRPAKEMPSDASAKATGADQAKEQVKVEAGQALASGATDVKQNREDVTTPAMIPDHKKPNNDGTRPMMDANPGRTGGGIVNQVTPPSVQPPGAVEQRLMKDTQPKGPDGKPFPAIPQDAQEIAASNPIKGASAAATPANVQNPEIAQAINTRVNVGTTPNTPVGLTKVEAAPKTDTQGKPLPNQGVAHDVVGPTGKSGTPGTGDSGITTGGHAPQRVEKAIVFTVLLADSKLKDMGFTHTVADNNSRQIIAAFASEEDAVKYSDIVNK